MKEFGERFIEFKADLQVTKDTRNSFGKFNYRTKEQIFEASKPLEKKHNIEIGIDNELVVIADRLFVKATATARDVKDQEIKRSSTSHAEFQPKAGTQMNESQLSGSAESYAGKYALSNLLGLDDNKDADNEVNTPKQVGKPAGMTVNYSKPKPKVEIKLNVDQKKVDITELRKETIVAKDSKDLNNILKKVIALNGVDEADKKRTIEMINNKGRVLGLHYNEGTKIWEEQ